MRTAKAQETTKDRRQEIEVAEAHERGTERRLKGEHSAEGH